MFEGCDMDGGATLGATWTPRSPAPVSHPPSSRFPPSSGVLEVASFAVDETGAGALVQRPLDRAAGERRPLSVAGEAIADLPDGEPDAELRLEYRQNPGLGAGELRRIGSGLFVGDFDVVQQRGVEVGWIFRAHSPAHP